MRNEESNSEFDPTLARALRQVDAPMSLETRLMAAAEKESRHTAKVLAFPQKRAWMSGAIAAALVMGVVIGERVHVDRQREQVAVTQQKFEDAMRVTNHALNQTQEQLAKAGLSLGE
jgi:hypothetical protein